MTDRIAVTILTLTLVIYFATLATILPKLELSNERVCCMEIPYIYMGRTDTVCYNPTDTTYNFVEKEIIRQRNDRTHSSSLN